MPVFVTGGAGYIGSHTVLSLLENGYEVVILDNFCNSSIESIKRVSELTNKTPQVYEGDVRDKELLNKIFLSHTITDVIHFAGLKSVGESVSQPVHYYDNNVVGSLALIEVMEQHDVKNLIFSSSATVYGLPESVPLTEKSRVGGTTNPYGTSKLFVEKILSDFSIAHPEFNITTLRYFNPVGAHSSGMIGENPRGIPNNLVPYITQVAVGRLECLSVYGNDYDTPDGTGVRDYIHVMDLAEGHIAAIKANNKQSGLKTYNLGTGNGYSVLQLLNAFEKLLDKELNYEFAERRHGDIPECWSDPSLALKELKWSATRNFDDMVRDSWNWQQRNPNGYEL